MQSKRVNKKGAKLKTNSISAIVVLCLFGLYISDDVEARERVEVARVIDGDTVVLRDGRHVRLLGINAPEISHHGGANEEGAIQAKETLERLIIKSPQFLESDKELFDHYGRTLAYLFSAEGKNMNAELVRLGLVTVNLYPPNLKYSQRLISSQYLAELEELGIWGLPSYGFVNTNDLPLVKGKGWGRFRGEITAIDNDTKGVKIWLGERVYVWVKRSNLPYFNDLDGYLKTHVEVRGWPRKRGRYWSIQVRHPSQMVNLLN